MTTMTWKGRDADFRAAAVREIERAIPLEPDLLRELPNDYGNAQRLLKIHGTNLRYCHAFRKWLVWDGRRWETDDTGRAQHLAKKTLLVFLEQAMTARDGAAEKFAKASLNDKAVRAMLAMAESDLFVQPAELDKYPDLLSFQNGTIDLRSGRLRPHDPSDLLTKMVHHEYQQEAKCPRWLAFLSRIMGGGPDASEGELERADRMMSFLQVAMGYSMTGHTSSKAIFVPFGTGNNGKTTLLSTYGKLIEEHSVLLSVDTLMVRQESTNSQADLADLRGARFVQTSEAEEGQRLAQGKLKRITQGMGKIKAVRKYENPVEFQETHKLWLDTNRRPAIRDADDAATFNRLYPIPFTVTIPPDEIDRDLPHKLSAEAEGILAWAVQGAARWYRDGLPKPAEIESASDSWRSESDHLGRFIRERCKTGGEYRTKAESMYAAYKHWCELNGERELSGTMFGRRLPEKGYAKVHDEAGTWYLGLLPETTR